MGFDPAIKRTRSAHNGVATATAIHTILFLGLPPLSRAVHSVVKCKRHRRRRLRASASCVRAQDSADRNSIILRGRRVLLLVRRRPLHCAKSFLLIFPLSPSPLFVPSPLSALGVPLPRFAPRPEGDIILVTCPLAPTYSTSFDPSSDFSSSIDLARTRLS